MSSPSSPGGDQLRSVHQPVLVRETLQFLDLQSGQTVIDGTVGGGGHSQHILTSITSSGRLIGLDRDSAMIARAGRVLNSHNCHLIHSSYSHSRDILDDLQIDFADRLLLDLGLSSDQLADADRGFSFNTDGPLDLRFDTQSGRPASQLLAHESEAEITRILQEYGEIPHAEQLAGQIIQRRKRGPIQTAGELADLVAEFSPKSGKRARHPATLVFQALRIAVNDELGELETTLRQTLPAVLRPGGRAVLITFHSLEDRLVKQVFRNKEQWENLTTKPVTATTTEIKVNPRGRSAKLRAAILRE